MKSREFDRYDLIAYRELENPRKIDQININNLSLLYFPVLPAGILLEIEE